VVEHRLERRAGVGCEAARDRAEAGTALTAEISEEWEVGRIYLSMESA
jgi:hypothetical protein